MSKALVVLLLVANLALALLIWQDAQYQPAPIVPGGDLKLVSESKSPDSLAAESALAETASDQAADQKTDQDSEAPKPEASDTRGNNQAAADQRPAKATPAAPVTPITKTPGPKEATKTRVHCYRYGPLDSRLTAIGIMGRLKAESQKQRIQEEPASIRYWLLAKPDAGVDAGLLEQMSLGEHQGSVVLGVFTTKAQAQAKLTELRAKIPNQQIQEVKGERPRFWVDFSSTKAGLEARGLNLRSPEAQLIKTQKCP
jgi:hypothetical protein